METPLLKINKVLLLALVLSCISCSKNDVYSEFKTIQNGEWHKDSLKVFTANIIDSNPRYNVFLNIRNDNNYSYQNFWLFISTTSPDGIETKDTIECYLADQRGQWLGSGVGQLREMSVLYQEKIHFPKPGKYTIKLVHGMRDTVLTGIADIGVRIEKNKEEKGGEK